MKTLKIFFIGMIVLMPYGSKAMEGSRPKELEELYKRQGNDEFISRLLEHIIKERTLGD